ncbi:hypothetical protein [Sorangium sp. So ce861]|uniref:hypothetical protein n=1 Tax=Sorangium sp. So ce861 TaxID=3133323 RepID=UPI003F61C571
MRVSRATSGAGDWTPVLSVGELGAVAVHLVELGHIAGCSSSAGSTPRPGAAAGVEVDAGGVGAAVRVSRATSGAGDWTPALNAGELGAVAVHLVELGHVAALDAGELAMALAYMAPEQIAGPWRRGAPRPVRTFRRTGGGGL